jgi:hypothetical protein
MGAFGTPLARNGFSKTPSASLGFSQIQSIHSGEKGFA